MRNAWGAAALVSVLAGVGIVVAALSLGGITSTHDPDRALPAAAPTGAPPTPSASPDPAPAADAGDRAITAEGDAAWVDGVAARTGIPPRALAAYAGASIRVAAEHPGCGLGWNTLAGIGHVESDHGRIHGSTIDAPGDTTPHIIGIPLDGITTDAIPDTDGGRLDGDDTWDRAVGPMQFIPSTWAEWGADGNADGMTDPQHIDDAALAAARYLCHVGGDLTQPDRWIAAIAAYNDTVEYNNRVAEAASHYARLG